MPGSWIPRLRPELVLPSEKRKRKSWMLTGRCFLEWGWGPLKSFRHPWDCLGISAEGLSSTRFPAPSAFLLAAAGKLWSISRERLIREGEFLRTQGGRLGQPRCSKIICWVNRGVVYVGRRTMVLRASETLAAARAGCGLLRELAVQSPVLSGSWQIHTHSACHAGVKVLGCLPQAFSSVNGQCVTMCPFKTTAILCHC